MPTRTQTDDVHPLRADARRNQGRLLAAAVDLFVDQGVDVPLETIARQAEVGIGTLYRHFADRDALIREVALRAFHSVRDLAHDVASGAEDQVPLHAFMVGVADLRVGVLMASLLPSLRNLEDDAALQGAFAELVEAATRLVDLAHRAGDLRPDVHVHDILLLLATVTRPQEGVPIEHTDTATHRLLQIAIQGLGPSDANTPLPPGPPPPEFPSTTE
jgi:AcrR family transcriptional regulator